MHRPTRNLALTSILTLLATGATAGTMGPATEACPDGVLTLTLLRAQNNLPPDDLIGQWEAGQPCTSIEVTEVPFGQLFDRISILGSSPNPPDILSYDAPDTASYASAGVLLPLDPYLPEGFADDMMSATRNENSYQGSIFSPGIEQATLALFYNRDRLDALGITPPTDLDDAWTWPEAIEAMRACQEATDGDVWGLAPSRFGAGTPGFAYRDLLFLRSAGDPTAPEDSTAYRTFWALSPDGTEVEGWLNTPEAVEAAAVYQAMFNDDPITPKAGIPNAFQDQAACFTIDMQYLAAGLQAEDPGFAWGVTPLPYFETPVVHTGSLTLGVSARTQFPDQAAGFVMDMSTGELAKAWLEQSGSLPSQLSLVAELPGLAEPPFDLFAASLERWGQPRPPSAKFVQYNRIVTEALRDIAYGADPQATLDAAAAGLSPILAE